MLAGALGFAAVLVGWGILVAMDAWPSGTFVDDQPGGVEGETIVLALVGATVGVWYAARR